MPVLRKFLPAAVLGAALAASAAFAQEAVDNPGRVLASNCYQCHGTNGSPAAGGFDRIAGSSAREVVSELQEMRAEAIVNAEHPIMTVHAQAYSLAEVDLIAAYLAGVGSGSGTPGGSAPVLRVAKSGSGAGTVTSKPSGIFCGSTCSKTFKSDTKVTLSATAAKGSVFAGWSGACSGTSTRCTVKVSSSKSVVAMFNLLSVPPTTPPQPVGPGLVTLKLEKDGKSYGTVTSSPAGIACGPGCEKSYAQVAQGTTVTLTAVPASRHELIGWSGACRGRGLTCTVTMTQKREVKAKFK